MKREKRKRLYYLPMIIMVTIISLTISFSVEAYKNKGKNVNEFFVTSKSDRTLIKEIHVSQEEMISLLREIKSMIKEQEE